MIPYIEHYPALIVAVPLFAAFLTPLISKIGPRARNIFVIAIIAVVEVMVLLLAYDVIHNGIRVYTYGSSSPTLTMPSGYKVPVRIIFVVDGMGVFMSIISATVTLAASIYSWAFMNEKYALDKFYTLLLLSLVGMFGMEFTGDLFNMFVFLEILSISAAALVATRTDRGEAGEAAFKYILVSAVGAMMMLFSIGLLYGQYDALNIAMLAERMKYTMLDKIALVLLIMAFAMKCGAVPMHMWVPDSYSEAPASITAMLVVISQVSLYALFRTAFTLYGLEVSMNYYTIGWAVIILGVLSMFIGVTMAIPQKDVKRLMAYHAISQTGYMLLGVGVGIAVLGNADALNAYGIKAMEGGIFHIINHAMYKGLLFLTSGAMFYVTGTRDLNKMGGLAHKMPLTTIFFMIGALAIAGIPPFNGYASKVLIYESVYKFNPILAIIAMVVSVLTLA
ncbi:MAG: NADH:ubiquinone oxidoreductase, partial [Thermoplasmata archaeon]